MSDKPILSALSRAGVPSRWGSMQLLTGVVREHRAGVVTFTDGRLARVAVSCLVQPEPGDVVAFLDAEQPYVVHVLERQAGTGVTLAVAGAAQLALHSPTIELKATEVMAVTSPAVRVTAAEQLVLESHGDCEVTAPQGTLNVSAQEVVSAVTGTLLQVAGQICSRAENIFNMASHLLSSEARRHLIVAEKEIRVDGETIQMG